MKTDQVWNRNTPLAAAESATVRSPEVSLDDNTGAIRVTCMPITTTAAYNVSVEFESDVGPWEPETANDITTGTKTGTDNKVTCYRVIHVMSQTTTQGFTVPTIFGFNRVRLNVWGAAGDLVQINITKLIRTTS